MSWNSSNTNERTPAAEPLEAQGQVEQGVQRRERSLLGSNWSRAPTPIAPSESPSPVLCSNSSTRLCTRPLSSRGVGALDPDGQVGEGQHPVEVDEHRDHPLLALGVAEHAAQEARLAELPRGVEPHVVAAGRRGEQLACFVVAVDDVVGRDRA